MYTIQWFHIDYLKKLSFSTYCRAEFDSSGVTIPISHRCHYIALYKLCPVYVIWELSSHLWDQYCFDFSMSWKKLLRYPSSSNMVLQSYIWVWIYEESCIILPVNGQFLKEIGRAHVWTPVTSAHLVCRLLLEKKKNRIHRSEQNTQLAANQ